MQPASLSVGSEGGEAVVATSLDVTGSKVGDCAEQVSPHRGIEELVSLLACLERRPQQDTIQLFFIINLAEKELSQNMIYRHSTPCVFQCFT